MYTYLWPIQVHSMIMASRCVIIRVYFVYYSPRCVKIWCKQRDLFWAEGSWGLKTHLVVKISSDMETEHSCQVCVLSMIFCRSDRRLWAADIHVESHVRTAGMRPRGLSMLVKPFPSTTWYDFTQTGQRLKWYENTFFTFDYHFYLNRDKSVLELFPVVVFQ